MWSPRPVLLSLFACGACAGVSVQPDAVRVDDLPTVSLSVDSARDLAALVVRALDGVRQRRFDEAETQARRALEIDPRSARARAVLGTVLSEKALRADPSDLFLANAGEAQLVLADRLAPADPIVAWLHAAQLARAGHMSAAAAVAEAALPRSTEAPPAERAVLLDAAGAYRYELGEDRAARRHLEAYLALRPDDAVAQFRLGHTFLALAQVPVGPAPNSLVEAQHHAKNAAAAFARCAEARPDDEDAALAVGAALLRAADLADDLHDEAARDQQRQRAEQQFRATAERFPASAEPQFRLGVVAELRGDDVAARAAYGDALLRQPDHLASLLNFAALQQRLDGAGADAVVRELLQRALRVDQQHGGMTDGERERVRRRVGATTRP